MYETCPSSILERTNIINRQFDTSPTQGWGNVEARSWARLGQSWGKVWIKSKVWARSGQARSGQARSGQGSGKVWARSGQKARFGQGRGKLVRSQCILLYSNFETSRTYANRKKCKNEIKLQMLY